MATVRSARFLDCRVAIRSIDPEQSKFYLKFISIAQVPRLDLTLTAQKWHKTQFLFQIQGPNRRSDVLMYLYAELVTKRHLHKTT